MENFEFEKGENIQVGRGNECQIRLDDDCFSRINCVLQFSWENNHYFLCDGDGVKLSKNGTWICNDQFPQLEAGQVFNVNGNVFNCD